MGNLTLEDVNNMYLDVLKEIGNIIAGSYLSALSVQEMQLRQLQICWA